MIEEIGVVIERFTADGAYDRRAIYGALTASGAANVRIVIPPKRTAAVDPQVTGPLGQRNDAIERIAEVGMRAEKRRRGPLCTGGPPQAGDLQQRVVE